MGNYAPDNTVSALMLAAMATGLATLGAGVYARVFPDWQPYPLVSACFIVAVEAALVRYRMREGRHLSTGALPYLAAELFALVVVMRVAATLSGGDRALAELQAWLRQPLAALDTPLVAFLFIGLACAVVVRTGLGELETLTAAAGPLRTEHALDAEIFRAHSEADEREAVARLVQGMAWGGILAIVAMVAQLADLSTLGGGPGALPPAMGLAGIAYLACGVMLYSRARLGMLRARWRRDETPIEPAVAPSWTWQSAGLVIAVVAIGLLLPRSYGAGVVDLARGLAASVTNILGLATLAIGVIALGLLGLILTIPALLFTLLGLGRPPTPTAPITPLPPPPPPTPQALGEPPIAPGIIFWICMGILAGYALWTVLRRQAWAVAAFERLRAGVLAPMAAWLRRLWGGATGYARKVGDAVAERLRRPDPPPAPRGVARLRLRALSPSELVRLYYALLLRRADELHQGRRPAETPSEYRDRLGGTLPEAEDDLAQLTETYLAAAYAPRPATRDEARQARGLWGRLRRRLRR